MEEKARWKKVENKVDYIPLQRGGFTYHNFFYKGKADGVVSLMGNTIMSGTPKIAIRKGKSQFGEQLIFMLLRDKSIPLKSEVKNTSYDTMEIYVPLEDAEELLQKALDKVKELKYGNKE